MSAISTPETDEEYRKKKAELLNRKFDISKKGDSNGDWLEHFKNFLTLAHQASYIAAEANFEAQRDFLRRAVSNLKLLDGNLIISYTSEFKTLAETANEDTGFSEGFESKRLASLHRSFKRFEQQLVSN